jgi:hypothetical protein
MIGGAALLMAAGVASAQLAVLPGQDIPAPGSGYGAPYSPRNAPDIDQTADQTTGMSTRSVEATGKSDETTGRAEPTFEDRWNAAGAAVPYLPPDAPIPNATSGSPQTGTAPASKDVPYSPE